MKRLGILLFSLGLFFIKGWAAEWQWSVPVSKVIASETGGHPQAFLWIPGGLYAGQGRDDRHAQHV